MEQTDLTNLINTVVKNPQKQASAQTAQPLNANYTQTNNKKSQNKVLTAAKEIGITAGMGAAGGVLAGGVASLIPTKNIDRVSNVLCDVFIKAADNNENSDMVKNLNINPDNAAEQIKKAKDYLNYADIFENSKAGTEEMKTAGQKLSNAAWALKQSAVEYIEKAAKDDCILQAAKKEARKIRTKDIMKNSISIGISTAFLMLLINTLSGIFGGNSSKENKK